MVDTKNKNTIWTKLEFNSLNKIEHKFTSLMSCRYVRTIGGSKMKGGGGEGNIWTPLQIIR